MAFNWTVPTRESLEQVFVEKGADTPSDIGTHDLAIANGYQWTGTSSTYGDLFHDRPREIIPWTLIQRNDGSGWYAGIELEHALFGLAALAATLSEFGEGRSGPEHAYALNDARRKNPK